MRKQFKEMILNEKDLAPAGNAQPATGSDDTSNNGTTSLTFSYSYSVKLYTEPAVPDKSVHPFDVLRKVSIQFEPYVMFVQVSRMCVYICMFVCICMYVIDVC